MALIPGALGIVGQTWAQAHLPPTRTAIVMSMEPVFAAFFAVLLGGESLTSRMLLGGALVLAAMLVVELGAAAQDRGRSHPPDGLTGQNPDSSADPCDLLRSAGDTTNRWGVRVRMAETVTAFTPSVT